MITTVATPDLGTAILLFFIILGAVGLHFWDPVTRGRNAFKFRS